MLAKTPEDRAVVDLKFHFMHSTLDERVSKHPAQQCRLKSATLRACWAEGLYWQTVLRRCRTL